MLLRGRHGTELELHVVGYEHPSEQVDPWDSNSLLVDVRLRTPSGSWHVVDPCLTTWEAQHMVRWLLTLAARPDILGGRLNEPNLTLSAEPSGEDDLMRLRACFALERRPPWLGAGDLCVDLDVDRAQLARAAADLHEDAARFPQRGDDPTL
jgi:hypothetical protein